MATFVVKSLKFLEVRPKEGDEDKGTTRWGNRDIYPIPPSQRSYNWLSFYAYWGTCGISLASWTIASAMIGYGLTAGQAMGAILIGSVLASFNAYLAGTPGAKFHLGYGMLGRAAWGLWGSYLALTLSCFESFVFYGINMYYGGEAVVIVLSAIFPSFLNMKNTLPESAAITTQALVGFVLFIFLYLPIVAFIPPHKLSRWLYPSLLVTTATFLGILGWSIHANHNSAGNLVSPAFKISKTEAGFRMIQSITSVAGTYTGGSNRVSDWTRYAKTKHAPTFAMLTALPVTVTLVGLVGVLVTSATNELFPGEVMWNPLLMLQFVQHQSYTPACRAGTFFAGLGMISTTLFINLTQNTVSSGMDLASMFPKYLTMRRGALIFALAGILVQPWRFLSQATTFITVLSSFGVFMAPLAAILMSDYWIIRRQKWNIPQFYQASGIYWFTGGINWRAVVAWVIAVFPSMPGFVAVTTLKSDGDELYPIGGNWVKVFQLNYFVGYIAAGIIYLSLNIIFPPPGLGKMVYMDGNEDAMLDGFGESESGDETKEIGADGGGGKEVGGVSSKALEV